MAVGARDSGFPGNERSMKLPSHLPRACPLTSMTAHSCATTLRCMTCPNREPYRNETEGS